jgi:hypothetical protein
VLVAFLLALAVLIVLNQANPLTTRLGRDSGMYAYVASHLLRGNTPYLSAWEHKPPGIFFIDAAGLALAGGTRWGIWLMEVVFLLAAALVSFYAMRRQFGTGPALAASLVWLAGLSLVLEGGNFTEEYSLLFSFAALALFGLLMERPASPGLHAAIGVTFGCSVLMRPNNAGVQASILLTEVLLAAIKQRPWKQTIAGLTAAGAGFLLPLLAAAAYFASRGAFGAFVEAGFIYNLSYGGHRDLPGAFVSGIRNLGFAAGLALAGTWVAAGRLAGQVSRRRLEPILLWLVIDFLIEEP